MGVTVRGLRQNDAAAWDAYVREHAFGSPFHLLAWQRSIEATFGYEPHYLLAEEESRIRGLLPLFLVNNFLVGKALLSSPFAVYGGILADNDEVQAALCRHASELARSLRVKHLEMRNKHAGQSTDFTPVTRYVTLTQEIGADEEKILLLIPRKTRAMVRKGIQNGLTTRVQTTDFEAFERLYSQNLRRLGTPSFPAAHFRNLLRNFQGEINIRETMHGDKVAAAVLTFYFRDQVLPYYGAADPQCNPVAPSNFMYFDLMREAGKAGYRIFDFGRSKRVSGSYDFKSHWGMVERELPYEMLLLRNQQVPNFSPTNPAYQMPMRIWRRLPLPVTRMLGPAFVRLVP